MARARHHRAAAERASAHSGALANAPLRFDRQFRARHQDESRGRCGWRRAARRIRRRRRRSLLDLAIDYDPSAHTTDNARRLVAAIAGPVEAAEPRGLALPADAHERARCLLPAGRPAIAIHVSGGRPIKQWPEERFRDVAAWLIRERGAYVVFTGTREDRAQVARVTEGLDPTRVADAPASIC